MVITETAICEHCGEEYQDSYVAPRAIYAPHYCYKCIEELNAVCGGSFMAAVYASVKHSNRSPMGESD